MKRKLLNKILSRDMIIFLLDHFGFLNQRQIADAFKIKNRQTVQQIIKRIKNQHQA